MLSMILTVLCYYVFMSSPVLSPNYTIIYIQPVHRIIGSEHQMIGIVRLSDYTHYPPKRYTRSKIIQALGSVNGQMMGLPYLRLSNFGGDKDINRYNAHGKKLTYPITPCPSPDIKLSIIPVTKFIFPFGTYLSWAGLSKSAPFYF